MNKTRLTNADPTANWGDTPGEAYVKKYIVKEYTRRPRANQLDLSWLAEIINEGELIICPRCHFVSLPHRPFPLDEGSLRLYGDPGPNACDICFFVEESASFPVLPSDDLDDSLKEAGKSLRETRFQRAYTLFILWLSSLQGADALIWNGMRKGIQRQVKRSKTKQANSSGAISDKTNVEVVA